MIFLTGNIFESECEVITVTVNCVGVMGAGIAKQCKELYPATFKQYRAKCKLGIYQPGQPRLVNIERPLLLFPTKNHWRDDSQYQWIKEGIGRIAKNFDHFESIAIPPLGCGHGNLEWNKIKALIRLGLGHPTKRVEVYEPKHRKS